MTLDLTKLMTHDLTKTPKLMILELDKLMTHDSTQTSKIMTCESACDLIQTSKLMTLNIFLMICNSTQNCWFSTHTSKPMTSDSVWTSKGYDSLLTSPHHSNSSQSWESVSSCMCKRADSVFLLMSWCCMSSRFEIIGWLVHVPQRKHVLAFTCPCWYTVNLPA